MYADDTVIFTNSANELQSALNNLHDYWKKWNFTVNEDKTKIIVFRKRKNKNSNFVFKYKESNLEIVDSFEYLGVNFSK